MNKFKINIKATMVAMVLSSSFMFASCSDWLNVKPSNQVSAEEQFSKEEGFKIALAGVYTIMSKPESYGREMTFGTVDYLGQYWAAPSSNSSHFSIYSYDFEATKTVDIVDKMWSNSYNAICNANDLLAFVDVNKGVFNSEMSYSVIKGEALAIRAYIHFDMLRLFAPNDFTAEASSDKWLPYVDVYSRDTKLSLTNKEFAERVIKDLEEAADLLKLDPIYTGTESSDTYFKNRFYHLNYYAVRALLARVYLYTGDKVNAEKAAQEVVTAQQEKGLFHWVSMDEVTYEPAEHRDRTFSSEHIFAINTPRISDNTKGFFGSNTGDNLLKLSPSADVIFEGNDEFRAKFVDANGVLTKFDQPESKGNQYITQKLKRIPLIRISEMYYILAECTSDLKYINMVRASRGIEEDLVAGSDLRKAISSEVTKEFIGEGQRFYYHKRINSSRIERDVRYTLIMPEDEINLGGRPRPQQ